MTGAFPEAWEQVLPELKSVEDAGALPLENSNPAFYPETAKGVMARFGE